MQVAFATQSLVRVDAHFGWARHFMVFDVSAEGYGHLRTVDFAGRLMADGDEGKLEEKLQALHGCALVFVGDIGVAARARLVQMDVRPLCGYAGQPIVAALDHLTAVLRGTPAGWLRRQEQLRRQAGD